MGMEALLIETMVPEFSVVRQSPQHPKLWHLLPLNSNHQNSSKMNSRCPNTQLRPCPGCNGICRQAEQPLHLCTQLLQRNQPGNPVRRYRHCCRRATWWWTCLLPISRALRQTLFAHAAREKGVSFWQLPLLLIRCRWQVDRLGWD